METEQAQFQALFFSLAVYNLTTNLTNQCQRARPRITFDWKTTFNWLYWWLPFWLCRAILTSTKNSPFQSYVNPDDQTIRSRNHSYRHFITQHLTFACSSLGCFVDSEVVCLRSAAMFCGLSIAEFRSSSWPFSPLVTKNKMLQGITSNTKLTEDVWFGFLIFFIIIIIQHAPIKISFT